MSLKLQHINILNFKSFKGTHTVSSLDNHFTAIVGPNGSGKSNILDSILFVLGFKARKMRHASLKDLITTGCTECKVELVFNTFTVARSLKGRVDELGNMKNATSHYELDGGEVSVTQVIEFLKSNGIDLDNNRFLILQGEIEMIAMMNPLELLEYIEDCIGTSAFKAQISQLDTQIRETQEEANSVANNLKLIETDYLFKKDRRDDKIGLLKCKNESLIMKNKIVLVKKLIAQRKEVSLLKERERIEQELQILAEKNVKSKSIINTLEKELSKLDFKSKEDELVRYRNEYSKIERDNRSKDAKRKRIEKNIERVQREMQDTTQALSNWEAESCFLRRTLEENKIEIGRLEEEIKITTNELNKFREIKEREQKKIKIEKTVLDLIQRKERHVIETKHIEALQQKMEMLEESLKKTSQFGDISMDKRKLESEIQGIKRDMSATRQEINKRKHRAEEFEFLEQSYRRECEVLNTLKEIPGVVGMLKNLGTFESKYEDAIQASTKALNSIVVDKTSTAEQCIEIINRKKLNRTTFIILDKLPEPEVVECEKCAVLLYKQIKAEKRYVKCFYYALKDTLCVEDIETAKLLAFGKVRKRVVTLDGKLLEKSGVMSGGRAPKKLKSSAELEKIYSNMQVLLDRKSQELQEYSRIESEKAQRNRYLDQIEEYKAEIAKRLQQIDAGECEAIESEIQKHRTTLHEIESMRLPMEAVELKGKILSANEQIDRLQKINQDVKIKLTSEPTDNLKALEKEMSRLQIDLNSIEMELLPDINVLNELEAAFESVKIEANAIQDQINKERSEMGGGYHEEARCKARFEEINESISDCVKIMGNCDSKRSEILSEFSLTRNLLAQIDPEKVKHLDEDLSFADEMDDADLKQASKQMIELLNQKEASNFRKLKEKDYSAEEDLEIYRMIFSEYDISKKLYDETKSRCEFLESELQKTRMCVEDLKTQRFNTFMAGFVEINKNIREIFNLITFGGNAELDLVDYLNPFNDGIILNIMPPKKAWKAVSNLSGGEKTLSSLSLIFALHKYRPSSFYIMDEIDAALDFKNVSVISQYLSHIDAQFIVISLRNDMFEMAKTLVGVYKVNDISRAITVNLDTILAP